MENEERHSETPRARNQTALIIAASSIVTVSFIIAGLILSSRHAKARKVATTLQSEEVVHTRTKAATAESQVPQKSNETVVITDTTTSVDAIPARVSVQEKQLQKKDTTSLSKSAEEAGESLKGLAKAAFKEARQTATETGKRIKERSVDGAVKVDSSDIHSLEGSSIKATIDLFEDMLIEIRKEGYDEQVILLDSYKALLNEQVRVVDARRRLASKLKPG